VVEEAGCDRIEYAQWQELELLIKKVSTAINENKYLIHYGI